MRTFIDFKKELDNDTELRLRYLEILDRMADENDGEITPGMSVAAAAELGFDTDASMFERERSEAADKELSSDELSEAEGGVSYDCFIRKWVNERV
ncbi:MAG: hypothetical protein J6X60_02970 [Ruminiclostridium sp.]|nr:hypothetical protein [Ruminiclostridium sp.]